MPGAKSENVTLPHTWNGIDGQDGGGDFKRCKCTYEKRFPMPELEEGGHCLLHFGAVNSEAEVFVNGRHAVAGGVWQGLTAGKVLARKG